MSKYTNVRNVAPSYASVLTANVCRRSKTPTKQPSSPSNNVVTKADNVHLNSSLTESVYTHNMCRQLFDMTVSDIPVPKCQPVDQWLDHQKQQLTLQHRRVNRTGSRTTTCDSSLSPPSKTVSSLMSPINHLLNHQKQQLTLQHQRIDRTASCTTTCASLSSPPSKIASSQMSSPSRSHRQSAMIVDLHGYCLDDAKQCVNDFFEYWMSNPMDNLLTIITGRGLHSRKGVPILKPYFAKFLPKLAERYHITFIPQNGVNGGAFSLIKNIERKSNKFKRKK